MLTPAERRRAREFDARVSAARTAGHPARQSVGARTAGLHRAPTEFGFHRGPGEHRAPGEHRTPGEHRASGQQHSPAEDDLADLLFLANRLGSAGEQVEPADEFRDRLRQRLVAVASVREVNAEPAFRPPPDVVFARPGRRRPGSAGRRIPRRVTVATGTLAGLVALSGVGFASGGANPGDALYGVKRSRESAQLTLARSPFARGSLYLQFARNRLAEASAATGNFAQLDQLLTDMDSDTQLGMTDLTTAAITQHHPAPLDVIDQFALVQQRQLFRLSKAPTPPAAIVRIKVSLALIDRISARSATLRGRVHCTGPFTTDALGPLPGPCSAASDDNSGVSSFEPVPPKPTWSSRPTARSTGWPTSRWSVTPSGSAARTEASSRPASTQKSSAVVDDDDQNSDSSLQESVVPQSGGVVSGTASGTAELPSTASTSSLVGSASDSAVTSDLTEKSGK